jgi:demethylmenaquinone methyltransferase/2-methoxy-6-polyprenyl-1,4-benzoquinol methylase
MSADPIRPHPTLNQYYTADAERPAMVRELFDEGAQSYEWICRVMSFGTGEWYRGRVLRESGLKAGSRLLDVAVGTGIVLRSGHRICGPTGLAIGLDPSAGMLAQCKASCPAPLVQGMGETLPFTDGTFDMVSMGYALRHVDDLGALFREFHRVLAPGGRVVVLELTQPDSSIARVLNRIYLRNIVPQIAYLGTGRAPAKKMMQYFWDTIETCVPPETILAALRAAGFTDSRRRVIGTIFSEYLAVKSA